MEKQVAQASTRIRRLQRVLAAAACLIAAGEMLPLAAPAYAESCGAGPKVAAQSNAKSLSSLGINLFGKQETGWASYLPLVSKEIATQCNPADPGFAAAFGDWQRANRLPPTGMVDELALLRMKVIWQQRRPFVRIRSRGVCPDAPSMASLTKAGSDESYGKEIQVTPDLLGAYRRLAGAARTEGVVSAGSQYLKIFSGFRAPQYDANRCKAQGNCDGTRRAPCSNHRTGLAVDMYLGSAPGFSPDDTARENREFVVRSPVYRWLVLNAGRFGFVNYAYEPWHWEYVGAIQ